MITILLKYEKRDNLIWEGLKTAMENTNQESMILELDGEKFYFYSTKIKKVKLVWKKEWISFKNKLNFLQQEKIINEFLKIVNKGKDDQKILLLHLQKSNLQNINSLLKEKKEIIKNIIEDKEGTINKEIDILNNEIKKFKLKHKNFIKKPKILNTDPHDFDSLSKKWSEITENFRNLKNKSPYIKNQFSKNLINERTKKSWLHKQKNKVIYLNNNKNKSLVWIGTNEKPETVNHKILTLKFDTEKFYFYPSGITTYDYTWSKNWINFRAQLNYHQQEKIIEAFDKTYDKTNFYHQGAFYKIKIEFLLNELKILNENFKKQEKIIISSIETKINSVHKKYLFIKNKIVLDKHINEEIIQQIINDPKVNEQNNKIEIHPNFNETNTKIETLKQKIIILNQKTYELNKNLNFYISILEKLDNYKSENLLIEDNTDKVSTSFNSSNETIIKQELSENLSDDIFIESEIEFNDHIKSEIIKQETEDNTDKPSTSFDLSNETIIDNLVEDYQPLLKKIKIEQSDSSDELDYLNY